VCFVIFCCFNIDVTGALKSVLGDMHVDKMTVTAVIANIAVMFTGMWMLY